MDSDKIIKFYSQISEDKNHRYLSWEHCYNYFAKSNPDKDKEKACLHLAFYLASWGMYRGSSFLLWKDYLIHKPVVELLFKNRHLQAVDFCRAGEAELKEIFDLMASIKEWYQDRKNIQSVNGDKNRMVNVTDTLATKIVLGTLGCIPAYDRYFIDGLRLSKLPYSGLKLGNFSEVVRFYKENKFDFECAQREIKKNSGVTYPSMKLVDMYFWQIGFENDPATRKKMNYSL